MKAIIIIIVCSACMFACYSPRYVYSPSTQNIPSLGKKNDLEISGFYAGAINAFKEKGNYVRGFDIHAAWAVSNHFGVMINESHRWEKNGGNDSFFPNDSSFLSYKRNFTEIGAGYFTSMEYYNKMQFQVFGGIAIGSSKIFDDFISNNTHQDKYHYSRLTNFFLQPTLKYSPFRMLSTALSSRFTAVVFSHIRTNYSPAELENYILDSLGVSPVFFWEPAVDYTFSIRNFPLKFQLQGSITVLLNHRFVEHRNGNIAVGITYDFLKPKNKKRSNSAK
jgi:hypothetical protein